MNHSDQEQMQRLLEKYFRKACTAEEAKQVRLWYETLDLYSADPEVKQDEKSLLKNKLWEDIQGKILAQEAPPEPVIPTKNRIIRLLNPFVRVAVAAAVLLVLGWFWLDRQPAPEATQARNFFVEKINRTTQPVPYELMDGSIVWLKPNSILRYPNQFRSRQREVYLEGEAFFEVAPNAERPFRVYSHKLIVRVLGTSFNVKAYQQDSTAEVMVRTGRVTVYSRPKEPEESVTGFHRDKTIEAAEKASLVLVPNQKITFYTATRQLVMSKIRQPNFWEKEVALHRYTFTNAPLEDVMHTLEETYRVSIQLENAELKNCTLTATLSNQPLDTKLEMICKSIGATFERRDSAIYITGKGCE